MYRIRVDLDDVRGTIRPLAGVNKGVRPTRGAREAFGDEAFDFTSLYEKVGMHSVRLHEGGFNVSNFARESHPPAEHPVLTDFGVTNQQGIDVRGDWLDWLAGLRSVDDPRAEQMYFDPLSADFVDDLSTLQESFLHWHPLSIANALPFDLFANLEKPGVSRAYTALSSTPSEIYFRFGEGGLGPVWIGRPGATPRENLWQKAEYGRAGASALDVLTTPPVGGRVPGYIEFWNETYMATDRDDTEVDDDWVRLYRQIRQELMSGPFASIPFGGFAFADGAVREILTDPMPTDVKLVRVLSQLDLDEIGFVSYHLYGKPAAGGDQSMDDIVASAVDFGRDLFRAQGAFEALFADLFPWRRPFSQLPAIHISEWALRLPKHGKLDVQGQDPVFVNAGMLGGAFASAVQTWMQHPELPLPVERAHIWAGRGPSDGLFHADRVQHPYQADDEIQPTPVFFIRTPALAMYLHADLRDRDWVQVQIEGPSLEGLPGPLEGLVGIDEAVHSRIPVTALATGPGDDGTDASIVVTNLLPASTQVTTTVAGLSPGRVYSIDTRRIRALVDTVNHYDYLDSTATGAQGDGTPTTAGLVPGWPIEGETFHDLDGTVSSYLVPQSRVDQAFEDLIAVDGDSRLAGPTGELELTLKLDAFGVLRIDLSAQPDIQIPTGSPHPIHERTEALRNRSQTRQAMKSRT
jgi:hypothetical protein